MSKKELANLTDEELRKKIRNNKIINATFIGCCIGIFTYSAVKNGLKFFTFFPLILIYFFMKNGKKIKELEDELKSRNS